MEQRQAQRVQLLQEAHPQVRVVLDAPVQMQRETDALRAQAQRSREFLAQTPKRTNGQGKELKTNVTDPDSAKMATSKGVIKGYAAQAAVDSKNQVIVAADVIGSGSEQSMLLPMVEQAAQFHAGSAGRHDNTVAKVYQMLPVVGYFYRVDTA